MFVSSSRSVVPVVTDVVVLSNLSEQEKIAKEIAQTEEVLSETLSRLTRLRGQQQKLRDRGAEVFRRGMQGLEEAEEPDPPVPSSEEPASEEQSLVGQAQSLGAFGVLDWEALGLTTPGDASSWLPEPLAGLGSSDENPVLFQGSGGS
jgi:hypothetical protein